VLALIRSIPLPFEEKWSLATRAGAAATYLTLLLAVLNEPSDTPSGAARSGLVDTPADFFEGLWIARYQGRSLPLCPRREGMAGGRRGGEPACEPPRLRCELQGDHPTPEFLQRGHFSAISTPFQRHLNAI